MEYAVRYVDPSKCDLEELKKNWIADGWRVVFENISKFHNAQGHIEYSASIHLERRVKC